MDAERFDALTRTFTGAGTRRRALGGLLLGSLGLLGWQSAEDTDAHDLKAKCKKKSGDAKKKCLKKAKKHAAQHASEPTLTCPQGQRPCRGACLSVLICCDETDCAGGRTCQNGTCACPATKPHICPGSQVCRECCALDDCQPKAAGFDGLACQIGHCVCTRDGTRRCASGEWQGWCGHCCDDSECSGLDCGTHSDSDVPHCGCTGEICSGVCVDFDCKDKCFAQCPPGVAIGQSCCTGLTCRPEFPEDTRGTCQP